MSDSASSKRCKIIVDAMGGDFAPRNAVLGALDALHANPSFELYLVGIKSEILSLLKEDGRSFNEDNIINATQIVGMAESPTDSYKNKTDSSIFVGTKLVNEGKADAFVSAGNTGAVVTAATFNIGRINGVERPTIGTFIPNETGVCTVFDVGAFVDSKPSHLLGYAVMGVLFVKEIYGIENPSIGLLSVGEEPEKGNKITKETYELLNKTKFNFVGNIEGRDILKGKVNVVICDGFIGNILLKFGESVPKLLKFLLKEYAEKSLFNKLRVGLLKGALKEALLPLDYQEYGGVPLLGVKGITIIGHGSSSVKAIKNMVLRANEVYEKRLLEKIEIEMLKLSSNS